MSDEPASYLTLERGTAVVDRFGAPVGHVERVLTLTGPFFDGLIVRTSKGSRFVDAPEVRRIRAARGHRGAQARLPARLLEPGEWQVEAA